MSWRSVLALAAAFGMLSAARADEAADRVAAQKKKAEANWTLAEAGEFVLHETPHLLIYAPKSMEKKLRDLGATAEKNYDTARAALHFDAKAAPWKGKLTVYVFAERNHFTAFARRVEKRRPESGEAASHASGDGTLHVAVSPPQSRFDLPVEGQAAEQVASVLLERKAGPKTVLPDWLVAGFGRATFYRAQPLDKATRAERKLAADLVAKKPLTAQNIWTGPLEADEANALNGVLADYFAYGPAATRFEKLLDGFKPAENVEKKTTEQAIEAAGMKIENVEKSFKNWIPVQR